MAKAKRSSTRNIDPFDIIWVEEDPMGRDVMMLKSIVQARENAGKHPFPPERLSVDEARTVISEPDFIDESVQSSTRDIYYKVSETQSNPFSRVVVDFKNDDTHGIAVSWSRYERPVATYGRKWSREG